MNYLKVYCNLIRQAERRITPEGYTEKHHTFPKSIFGKNDRIVVLTAREHYIAHALLEKVYIKRYGLRDKRTHKMIYAHTCMKGNRNYYVNSYLYECAMMRRSIVSKGKKHSEETKKKIGNIHRGKKLTEEQIRAIKKRMISNNYAKNLVGEKSSFYGKHHSQETKDKISQKKKGKKHSEETKKKIGNFKRGKKLSEETKKKLSDNKRKNYTFINPSGEIIVENTTLPIFCKKNKLDISTMYKLVRGLLKQHKGWTVYKLS